METSEVIAIVGGHVNQELLLRNDYLAAENEILKSRSYPGRPKIDPELEPLVLKFAEDNPGWRYDRIAGALRNLGYDISDQTVGNILKKNGLSPAPTRTVHHGPRSSNPTNISWRPVIPLQRKSLHRRG